MATIAVVTGVVGAGALAGVSIAVLAIIVSVAAGALLAMVCNAMIPEAFEEDHWATGLSAATGFLVAFVLNHVS